jgi:hypothetical protein
MDVVRDELRDDPTVDITTTGRRSGQPRRIEIWMLDVDGRFFITGTPGRRDWLANVIAYPDLVVHLKRQGHLASRLEPGRSRTTTLVVSSSNTSTLIGTGPRHPSTSSSPRHR